MKPHKNLLCWQDSFKLTVDLYKITKDFPNDEKFGITSQVRRAASSIPINIAEGAARNSNKEFVQFLYISLGSLSELDTLLLLCIELSYIEKEKAEIYLEKMDHISKLIIGLIKKVKVDAK
jgi:four helix bundle protein